MQTGGGRPAKIDRSARNFRTGPSANYRSNRYPRTVTKAWTYQSGQPMTRGHQAVILEL
jgi:hypothetical protein